MNVVAGQRAKTCFQEDDPESGVLRRATVEFIGTALLMLAATGAGLTSHRLFQNSLGLGLFVNAIATAGSLVALIFAFGSASGGHFNPLITLLQWLSGERKLNCTVAYVAGQFGGAIAGVLMANGLFQATDTANDLVTPWALVLSEAVASGSLMVIVFGCSRSGRKDTGPIAVGLWLAAAILATPSASYANPAITFAAFLAEGPISLSALAVSLYVPAEILGALVALAIVAVAYPTSVLPPRADDLMRATNV